ncbi:MAG: cell division protein FtsQ/DivIB [Cyanobium sp.]
MPIGRASDTSAAPASRKPRDSQSPPVPLPPGAARRKELRLQRRAERWRNLWRLLVFSGLSAGLGLVLLRHGWTLRDPSQVEVSGSRLVSRDQVIQAGGLRFPLPLLTLDPRRLGGSLAGALPVEEVRVHRTMLPPRLRIDLVDRQAVARAQRRTPRGPEQGFIDRVGNWIDAQQSAGIRIQPRSELLVTGWNERHRQALALVLDQQKVFGPDLREVRFEADGSLWLITTRLGPLRLGPEDGQLPRRLQVAAHLQRTLPGRIRGQRPQQIDLSDPEQPELSLVAPVRSDSGAPGTATASRPPGGQ